MATSAPKANGQEREQGWSSGSQLSAGATRRSAPLTLHASSPSVQPRCETAPRSCGERGPCSTAQIPAAANSCGLAPLPLPLLPNADRHTASSTSGRRWEPAGLKRALAHSKTNADTNVRKEKEGKRLSWQPCRMQLPKHQPASQSSLPPYPVQPVKLIIKHLQERSSLFTPSILPVWSIYSPKLTTTAEWRFAQKATFSYYSFRKSSKSLSPAVSSAIPTSLLPDSTGAGSWQQLGALTWTQRKLPTSKI